jgi:methionyl aminopeptidase
MVQRRSGRTSRAMIFIKSNEDLKYMRRAGRIVAETLALLIEHIRPGVTTGELDRIAEQYILSQKARPAFKGYNGYPASICTSINEEIVHGIPGPRRLQEGDIISLDLGAVYRGFYGDAAVTVGVGRISPEAERLLRDTEAALYVGIAQALPGKHIGDISWAIQSYLEQRGYGVVREYVGHGVGRSLHEEPQVPNVGAPGEGPLLRPGMTLAIEPMANLGTHETEKLPDGWTVVTRDRSLSAHFEHTVCVTEGEPEILTALAGARVPVLAR